MTLHNILADTNNIFYFAHTTTKHKYPKPDAKAKYNCYKYLKKTATNIFFRDPNKVSNVFSGYDLPGFLGPILEIPCRICEKNLLLKIN